MNQERFNHYWLYVIDLHNHSSVGDLRLVMYFWFLYLTHYQACCEPNQSVQNGVDPAGYAQEDV